MRRTLEQFRKLSFWGYDILNGSNVLKHYKQIKRIQDKPNSPESTRIIKENLSNILKHAGQSVPYYDGQILSDTPNLEEFPVIDKQTVRDNFEAFRSVSFKNAYNHQVLTSGSTGKPFKIYHDRNKRFRNTADTIFFAQKAGYEIGAKLYYLRLWDKQYFKSKFQSWSQNVSPYSVDDLDDENIPRLVNELESDRSEINVLAYTSALDSICKYLEEHRDQPLSGKFSSIIAMAEALGNDVKQKVYKYFGAEVLSRYSNSENGILAQQTLTSSGKFEINTASYHIELLDLNKDEPVKPGEPGRIVLTDYYNYAMPMVRYDTGDVGILEYNPITGQPLFAKIEGRKMDMFINTKGEFISSHIIHHILQFKGIEQFQFIQESLDEYIIKMKVSKKLDKQDENALQQQYLGYFGQNAKITIQYVEDIPLLASGKRKLVINNVLSNQKRTTRSSFKSIENYDLKKVI
ncbi:MULTISPECIES: phenylacetate--CoA ligase family protein [Flavobacteriaceae]|uniref:phenylacetate--CoA ligase family protein n=1 Tax=Flavobacteriaceae TaxID=49546 RepID=UPI00149128C1|nr:MULTISPECIES: phenylacetate--CoA ligase family protein [Allomuricauda]MDC6366873.1 phenylacetate--CoA ligase family protein [Muricauda sp. AC10]